MRSRTRVFFFAMTIFAALALPYQMAAQHTRYKLIDIGTFGGPNSSPASTRPLDSRGTLAGQADTSTPDPYPDFCFSGDCFVSHAFQWQNGLLTDLGVLTPGVSSSSAW